MGRLIVDAEKVCNGLEYCVAHNDCDDNKCPYDGHCAAVDALSLIRQQQARIRELEAERTARVMTLEEVEDALDTVVWLDMPESENLADGYSLIMAYSRKNGFVMFDSPFGYNPSQDRFEYEDYGKTWRCWTQRPTDEQRKEVKWDD